MKRIDKYSLEECRDKFFEEHKNIRNENPGLTEAGGIYVFVAFCNEEIKTIPRIATITTAEEYDEAEKEKNKICAETNYGCINCRLRDDEKSCMSMYLAEEIEVKG